MADFFEFQESDIIFSDDVFSDTNQSSHRDTPSNSRTIIHRSRIYKQENCSFPVNIPENHNQSSSSSSASFGYGEVELAGCFSDDDEDYRIVPPHVIVDRRSSDFDSFVKIARPKNLIHVRNSVLKLTGFLES